MNQVGALAVYWTPHSCGQRSSKQTWVASNGCFHTLTFVTHNIIILVFYVSIPYQEDLLTIRYLHNKTQLPTQHNTATHTTVSLFKHSVRCQCYGNKGYSTATEYR